MLPVVVIDGVLITESSVIQEVIETKFSDAASYPSMMPPKESAEANTAQTLFRLERKLFSDWMQWLTGNFNEEAARAKFCQTLDEVDLRLRKTSDSPYFLKDIRTANDTLYVWNVIGEHSNIFSSHFFVASSFVTSFPWSILSILVATDHAR